MIGVGAKISQADRYSRYLARRANAIKGEIRRGQREAGDLVVDAASRKSHPRQTVTVQDHRAEVRPRPPRIAKRILPDRAQVSMGGSWGHARDPVVTKLMQQTGHQADLYRGYLWVEQPILGGGVLDAEKMRFKDRDWLDAWGERENKGQQRRRHAVRLPPEVRMRLTLAPALAESQEEVVKIMRYAFLRALV